MGKKIKKLHKKIDPFTAKVIDPMLGEAGLPNIQGRNAAREQAEKQSELTRQQQEQMAAQSRLMQSNFAADLKGENLATVVAGGTAEEFAAADPTKRRRAGGLTAALGV